MWTISRGWCAARNATTARKASRTAPARRHAGIFTVQYPEEQLLLPEEARYLPFLVYDEGRMARRNVRCTSCGICAKVCPPQCIWIVRTNDPVTRPPGPRPGGVLHRRGHLHELRFLRRVLPVRRDQDGPRFRDRSLYAQCLNMEKLLKPASYYASIRPQNYARRGSRAQGQGSRQGREGQLPRPQLPPA